MNLAALWKVLLLNPITNVLVAFYKLFEWLHIPGPLGWAIILMTVTIRLILYPLMHAQLKSAKKMQELKPHLDALAAKHKDDKTALQQAQLALYKEHGVNPAAGCLPLLIQMPVLIALYNVFYQVLNNTNLTKTIADINKIIYFPALKLDQLNITFFGTNLAIKPNQWQSHGWWLLAVPVITGLLQWYQTKLMLPNKVTGDKAPSFAKASEGKQETGGLSVKASVAPKASLATIASGQGKAVDKKDGKPETDQAAEMQQQMAIISPLMFAFFAFQFPLGLALYWNVFGLFGIMQQLKINKG